MNIIINPTNETRTVNGCEVRVWNGLADEGIRMDVLVSTVIPRRKADVERLQSRINDHLSRLRNETETEDPDTEGNQP